MKRIFFIVIVALCAISAEAQVYVGGTFGISVETNKADDESHTNSVYSISPEVGYQINKVWSVGVSVGASYTVVGGGDDVTMWGVSPYVRAIYARAGAVDFFAEGAFSYEKAKNDYLSVDGWGIGLRPGILVNLSKRLQLVGRTVLFKYSSTGDKPYKVKQTGFTLGGNNVEVGVQYNF